MKTKLARFASVGARGLASIADQGAAAAISFAASVFIGRHLGAEALGIYAITNVFVTLVRSVQNAVVLEPMSVFGPRKLAIETPRYFAYLIGAGSVTVGFFTIVLAIATLIAFLAGYINRDLFIAMLAGAFFSNLLCFQFFLRRQFYIDQRQYLAAIQSVSYLILVVAGFAVLWFVEDLTVVDVYTLLTAGSIIVCAIQGGRFWSKIGKPSAEDVRRYTSDHWKFGKWVLLAIPLGLLTYNGYFFIVGSMVSTEAAGYLKTVDTLVAPFSQVAIGLGLMLVPMASRDIDRMSIPAQKAYALRLSLPLIALSIVYGAAMFFGGAFALKLLFGDKLTEAIPLIKIMALIPFLQAVPLPAGIVLSALQRSNLRFVSHSLGVVGTFAVSVPLIMALGLPGAAMGMVVSLFLYALSQWGCLFWLWRRMARQPAREVTGVASDL